MSARKRSQLPLKDRLPAAGWNEGNQASIKLTFLGVTMEGWWAAVHTWLHKGSHYEREKRQEAQGCVGWARGDQKNARWAHPWR